MQYTFRNNHYWKIEYLEYYLFCLSYVYSQQTDDDDVTIRQYERK